MSRPTGIVNLKGKDYATVPLRVHMFRERHPIGAGWGIQTEIEADERVVVAIARVIDPEGRVVATGTAEEFRSAKGVNSTSAVENAETSAVGRALAFAGFSGDASLGIASAEEVQRAIEQQEAPPPARRPAKGGPYSLPTDKLRAIHAAARDVEAHLGWSEGRLIESAKEHWGIESLHDFGGPDSGYRTFANRLNMLRGAIRSGVDVAVQLGQQPGESVWTAKIEDK